MYIAYETEEQDGIECIFPIGILKNKNDVELFKSMSSKNINIEKIPMIDMRKVNPIKYITFWYRKDGSHGWSEGVTNSLMVKQV